MVPNETDPASDDPNSEPNDEDESEQEEHGDEGNEGNGGSDEDDEIEEDNTVLQLRGSRSRLSSYLRFPLDRLSK